MVWSGLLVGPPVLYFRSGLGAVKRKEGVDWREFFMPDLGFFLLMVGKAPAWPVTLGVWVARGKPRESAWQAVTVIDGRPVRRMVRTEGATAT
jgi:hypothetical protein